MFQPTFSGASTAKAKKSPPSADSPYQSGKGGSTWSIGMTRWSEKAYKISTKSVFLIRGQFWPSVLVALEGKHRRKIEVTVKSYIGETESFTRLTLHRNLYDLCKQSGHFEGSVSQAFRLPPGSRDRPDYIFWTVVFALLGLSRR